ncbi:MAG: DUF1385 domain-containing protein [Bryobacterales bacterium]|nr:DUF1385 domain-containing protein [Bryobacteraceae bacterium]MDW8354971.1 DUF1385 domain-containing protein [Bryobacterales bacterium]
MSSTYWVRLALQAHVAPWLSASDEEREALIGGQAVIEGVMMRAPHSYAVAVRRPSGELAVEQMPVPRVSEKYPAFRWPLLRGLGTLGQAMYLGIKALRFSANVQLEGEGKSEKIKEISPAWMGLNLAVSLGFFIFLYKFVPLYVATALGEHMPVLRTWLAFNLTDGLVRIGLFLAFLVLISQWKEIRRVFEYHGAEHKVVSNYESGLPVTVENAQRCSRFHPRCGTSFLLAVMVIAIGVYALLPFDSFLMRFAGRLLLLPLIAGISYELIRWAARHPAGLLAALTAPGLWLQRITTRPPSDDQVEVAIHALERAMALEEAQGGRLVIA